MDWSDLLKLALSIFLILTGVGLAYLFLRMAGVFGRLGTSVTRITDEVVPILNKAQTTVDGVNLELMRVDEMMKTAVGATAPYCGGIVCCLSSRAPKSTRDARWRRVV